MESRAPIELHHLLPGDLLLFRPSIQTWFMQQIIMLVQALLHNKHGHYDTTHVAICIGHDEQNQPKIAHVTEKHERMGFIEEKLEEMFHRDDGDRPFLVFRPKDPRAAAEIANIAGHPENHNKNMEWKLRTGIKALLTNNSQISPTQEAPLLRSLSRSTICSQFVIETLKIAAKDKDPENDFQHEYPAIHSTSTPKVLEGYLYKSKNYSKHCYLGKDGFKNLANEIEKQINRIGERPDHKSKAKYALSKVAFHKAIDEVNQHREWNEMEKSIFLIKIMLPTFRHSTGLGFFNTTSYSSLLWTARKMGIFERDINAFSASKAPSSTL